MSKNDTPIYIVLTSDNLTQSQLEEINRLTHELGELLKKQLGVVNQSISYVNKKNLPQNTKVADLLIIAGQVAVEIAPAVANLVTPWILGKVDEMVKAFAAKRKPVTAKVIIGNHEEIITPATSENDIDIATERIQVFSESPGNRFALVIGVSTYIDKSLPALNAPALDAERFAQVLRDPNIGAFTDVDVLTNKNKDEIEQAIERFYGNKHRDDLLLLYYSGHGIKSQKGQLLLTASNTTSKARLATSITGSFIKDNINESNSERQVLILDCCFGGAIVEGAKGDNMIGQDVNSLSPFKSIGHGNIIITASDKMQYATDGKVIKGDIQNSLFTHHLIEGLEKGYADTDNDGRIEIRDLYNYVFNKVMREQTPIMEAHIGGEIIIGLNPNRIIQPADLPDEIQSAMRSKELAKQLGAIAMLELHLRENLNDKTVKEAVKNALHMMTKDDSKRVSSSAQDMYNKYFGNRITEPSISISRILEPSAGTKSSTAPKPDNPISKPTKNSNLKIIVIASILILLCSCIAWSIL